MKVPTKWTYKVNADAQIEIEFDASNDDGYTANGNLTLSRSQSLEVALGVLRLRGDVVTVHENGGAS